MRKLFVLLTALALGLLGAACSSDVGSCVINPDAASEASVPSGVDAPAVQLDAASPAVDAPQAPDAAGLSDGGAVDDATPAQADSGSD